MSNRNLEFSDTYNPDDVYSFEQLCPKSEKEANHIANKCRKFALKETSLNLRDFTAKVLGMTYSNFLELCEKFPQIKAAKEFAFDLIGARRDRGALKKKFDSGVYAKSQWKYEPETRAFILEQSNKDAAGATQKIIVIEKVPSSPMVPDKKIDDDSK